MKQPLISIIIPIYKVEAYLDRCVQSVADQTYRNLEIILVDDGSPDRCPDICDSWSEKDSRIRVIHKENGGLSDARNAGIRAATGELIGFVDGDDYISGEMYEILYDRILADGSDIAACGVNMIWEDSGKTRLMTKEGTVVLNHEDAMRACIDETWLIPPVWNKLYRKELVNDLFFPVGKYHEDVFWTWKAIAKAESVSFTGEPCYYYVQRAASIMGEKYSLKRLDAIEAKIERLDYLRANEKDNHELLADAEINLIFSCLYHGQLALRSCTKSDYLTVMNYLNQVLRKNDFINVKYKKLKLTHSAWLKFAMINIRIACRLRNSLNIGI